MKVLLSQQCLSLTGMLERGLGYHLVQRKNGFFARRDSKGFVPPDGHWRFIVLCAELAQNKLHITDIQVPGWEIYIALEDAQFGEPDSISPSKMYNAKEVLELKERMNL